MFLIEIKYPITNFSTRRKENMSNSFLEGVFICFLSLVMEMLLFFLTTMLSLFLNKRNEQNDPNEIKVNIKSHSASLFFICLVYALSDILLSLFIPFI